MQHYTFNQSFTLNNGAVLDELTLAYETYGKLNDNQDNVIVINHSLGTGPHVAAHPDDPGKGWWHELVGPGLAIDTQRYFVICINNIGSCFGSSGPLTLCQHTGKPFRNQFPQVSIEDMVISQKLLLEHLGIHQLYAVIGGSMGGVIALCWGQLYPQYARYIITIASSHKAYPLQCAYRTCQREAIFLDPAWAEGAYQENPVRGLKVARMISHLLYRGFEEVDRRFNQQDAGTLERDEPIVNRYYHYNADKFARRFDANAYVQLLNAMDNFNLEDYGDTLFKGSTTKVLVISTDTDELYPPRQQQAQVNLLKAAHVDVKYIMHHSVHGHDAFLVEAQAMGDYIVDFFNQA